MSLVVPPGVQSDGSWRVAFVATLANPAAPKIATEIDAAGSVDGSCLLTKEGVGLDNSVDTYKDERLCTIDVFEEIGSVTWSVKDLEFIIDPQTPASASNKLYALIKAGWSGYLVIRMGLPADQAWATTDKVWVVPVRIAPSVPLPPEKNTKLRAKATVVVNGNVEREVTPAA